MTILAETYIHLKIHPSKEFKIDSKEYLFHKGYSLSDDFFKQVTKIDINIEDGSFKS